MPQGRGWSQPLFDRRKNALLAYQQTLLLQPVFKARFLEAFLRFFEAREQAKSLFNELHFALHICDARPRPFQLQAQLGLLCARARITLHEAFQQQRQLLTTLCEFRDFVLTKYFNTGNNFSRRQIQDIACLVLHHGRIWYGPFDRVVLLRRMVRSDQEGHLRAALQHMLEHALMGFDRLLSDWIDSKCIAKALNDRGLPCASAAHQNIQVAVEVQSDAVKESTLPCQCNKLRMRLGLSIAVQAYARIWIEKCLPQTFN